MLKLLFEELKERGLISAVTSEDFTSLEDFSIYCGFDPTSDSLHIGNIVPMIMMKHFQMAGVKTIGLIGSSTGMIGDPSGKSSERSFIERETILKNCKGIEEQIKKIINPNTIIENSWIESISVLDWFRDIGKMFSVNYMISKDSVKSRIERDQGISYTEFSYMLIQAYDFCELFNRYNCAIQIGGSDQWGNITAGIDFIRKRTGKNSFGITCPLIMSSNGEKLGKSSGNSVWLSKEKTSISDFYNYWLNVSDADVESWLKMFTFISLDEIQKIINEHNENKSIRIAQRTLAKEMTIFVHGKEEFEKNEKYNRLMFSDSSDFSNDDVNLIMGHERTIFSSDESIISIFEKCFSKTKSEVKRLINGGGITINGQKITNQIISIKGIVPINNKLYVLSIGKSNKMFYSLIGADTTGLTSEEISVAIQKASAHGKTVHNSLLNNIPISTNKKYR